MDGSRDELLGSPRAGDDGRGIGAANLSLPFSAGKRGHESPISTALSLPAYYLDVSLISTQRPMIQYG